MAQFVTISDPVAEPKATGRVRCDHRAAAPAGPTPPTLCLLGGMTQTLSSWGAQLRPLAAHRDVLAWEARGQGATELSVADCSPAQHVRDFVALIEALGVVTPVDLCGFSFGGRVCLGIAATRPDLVRRLVISGVGFDRDIVARLIVRGWLAALQTGDLEALARVSLPDILGRAYLEANAGLVDSIVQTSMTRNRYDGIVALMRHTMQLADDSPWATPALAGHVQCPALVMGGADDRLAPPAEVAALADAMKARHHTFEHAGHTVPIEVPQPWRAQVEAFLAENA